MTKNLGQLGEDLAVEFLKKNGYQIIERNFRIRDGELDIIAIDGRTLVYIEVKTRSSRTFGLPEEAVTPSKLRFLERAAKFYRNARQANLSLPNLERIDVVAVDLTSKPQIKLIKNAAS